MDAATHTATSKDAAQQPTQDAGPHTARVAAAMDRATNGTGNQTV